MSEAQQVKFFGSMQTVYLEKDMKVNGKTIPAGTTMVFYPMTVDRGVMIGDQSLEDLWGTLSKVGHIHRNFSTSTTAAATQTKTVTVDNFSLTSGACVSVRFANTNTASNPMLNVNNTGSKAICVGGSAIAANRLQAGVVYFFVYDGTNYEIVDGLANVKCASTLPQSAPADLADDGLLIVG
ncbi:MAG: hypothetical protein IJU76_14225 [Desulfovibrionaceae bacterium]|nr:hypothetical protein [Desulfovibrionaceae bacterium]